MCRGGGMKEGVIPNLDKPKKANIRIKTLKEGKGKRKRWKMD